MPNINSWLNSYWNLKCKIKYTFENYNNLINNFKAVVVEGSLVWADKADYTFDAYYIISRKGEIYIGQEGSPYQHKLVITLHGNEWGVQFPMFGNKCIVNH